MEAVMIYTNYAIWCLGAAIILVALATGVQWLAWRLYKDVVGWPVIAKAMKAYRIQIKEEKERTNDT